MNSTVTLPHTNLTVSRICLGTGGFGSSVPSEACGSLLEAYVSLGGNFIDTAHNYGDWIPDLERSASERAIGRWLKQTGAHQNLVLATKGGHPLLDSQNIGRLSRAEIREDCHASLEALGIDSIDLYWLHADDLTKSVESVMDALFELQDEGSVRYLGASNWQTPRIQAANDYADSLGRPGFVADQTLWNAAVLQRKPYGSDTTGWMNAERFAYLFSRGMSAIPYQSQAFGLFHRLHAGTIDQMNPGFRGFYEPDSSAARYDAMKTIIASTGLTISQVVLGYLLSQPIPTVPIVGCQTEAQVRDTMSALQVTLTPDQVASIDQGHPGSELKPL